MGEKVKDVLIVAVMAVIIFGISLWCILKEPGDYSQSERRYLAHFPKADADTILIGSFMSDYEVYAADQFPCRETFRGTKAFSELYLFKKLDSNSLFLADGHISKIDYPLNEKSLDNAANKFMSIYENYLESTDVNIYLSIIPDKNYFLAEDSSIISIDFEELQGKFCPEVPFAEYIDIYGLLDKDDYYKTDTHWKQECIVPVAEMLADKMGAEFCDEFEINELSKPFYGVYYGQLGLYHEPDTIKYLENDMLRQCIVISYSTGKAEKSVLYNMEKADGKDPYEMFLSGSEPLITIENHNAETNKELVIFRDSFGSSIAPLMLSGYSKITLVDLRYMHSDVIGEFIDFKKQDILFLYSTMILNNSFSFR